MTPMLWSEAWRDELVGLGVVRCPGEGEPHARGARVVSVFGPFGSRTLVDMPTGLAVDLFEVPLGEAARTDVIDAALREVAGVRSRDPELADSALAASAVALAYEIAHPWNSATSKSMCARELREHMDRLRELLPPEEDRNPVDDLRVRRTARRAGMAAAEDLPDTASGDVGQRQDGARGLPPRAS